jgi:hypothetical protein
MAPSDRPYWFPAKRYGWGWGTPTCWQGWTVLLGYLCLGALGIFAFRLPTPLLSFVAYQVLLTVALVVVCWKKGEPPRWRWGEDERK